MMTMAAYTLTAIVIAFISVIVICEPLTIEHRPRSKTFNVQDFGAKGDGSTKDTNAIRAAASACETAGGGILLFPTGKYLTAPFNLTSGMTLEVTKDAEILGSTDRDDYPLIAPLPSYGTGRENRSGTQRYHPLIYAVNASDIVITGSGTINGQGSVWYKWHEDKELNYTRPHLIELQWVTDATVTDITLTMSPFWTLHPVYCDRVSITLVQIYNPVTVPNTDGIDPDSSSNVYIANCVVACGDDNIAIKSGWDWAGIEFNKSVNNVLIEDCEFGPGEGLSIGSETGGGVWNITARNITMRGSANGIHVKSARGRGGHIYNLFYDGFKLDAVGTGIAVSEYYTKAPPTNVTATPVMSNFYISNFSYVCQTFNSLYYLLFECVTLV
eukprot:TRINITY_DN1670_c0_g1_i2.p1 TRINITY_DN1670_c0_g1~~TRINITY_DN1670_c0_g1_i2.p1  ORF type:complete len:385 (-),score=65.28 TRINITY_DN1670_c0_g1_i2:512-1666(-)